MSNYRQQSGGTLGNLTTCPTCYDTLYLLKGSSVTNVCCDSGGITVSPTYETVYVAQGQTFATATMWYDDTSLTTPSGNAWWTDDPNLGSRSYRRLTRDAVGYHKALSVAMNPDKFAKFFYEQGKSDAIEGDARKAKNINMTMRKAPETVSKGGMQIKALSNNSGRGLKIRSKK